MEGVIFNIQKFSIHDGPGVRTTVFLKGCPLRCKWCSNPESQLSRVQIMYHSENCVHCRKCVHACPEKAISVGEDGRIHIDFQSCKGCLSCVQNCPGRALTNEGEKKSADEVVQVCLQDIDFYEESGGGVTISGGEGMAQPDFVEAIVLSLKEKGIHTAIETTGCVAPEVFHRLAPLFDLLLFDVKHFDSEEHRRGTGVGNGLILENLRWAYARGLNVLARIPVIPGFNAALADAKGIAEILCDLGKDPEAALADAAVSAVPAGKSCPGGAAPAGKSCPRTAAPAGKSCPGTAAPAGGPSRIRVQLLPFHQMGERKYEFLNRPYELTGVKALHPEDLEDYRKIFLDHGLDCFF